jgi:hypothetical protein
MKLSGEKPPAAGETTEEKPASDTMVLSSPLESWEEVLEVLGQV